MSDYRRVASFGVLAVLCLLAVGSVDSGDSGSSGSSSSTGASASSPPKDSLPNIGDVGVLAGGGKVVAHSKDDFDEMLTLVNAKDNDGLAKMLGEGRIFFPKDGTKARVLEYGGWGGGLRVRIVSGNFRGEDGWIVTEGLHSGK